MFSKNIEALKLHSKKLAEKIENLSLKEAQETISLAKNSNEDLILLKNNIPIDDVDSPYDYAKKHILENIKKEPKSNDFIIIFGLGLGYLMDVTFQNLPAKIIVFEPDLNVLRFVFETVDMTPYLNSNRVYLSNNLDAFLTLLNEKYILNDKIEILYLKNYVTTNLPLFSTLTEKLAETCESKIMDVNTTKLNSKFWVRNILAHHKYCQYFYPSNVLENKFEGKTALITAGGPSLKDDLAFIKQNRDKFVIFAINRSLNSLMNYNIVPDFAVLVDSQKLIATFKQNKEFLAQINFVVNLKTDYYVYQIPSKRIFVEFPKENSFAELIKEKLPNEIKLYNPSSTATLAAYNLVLKMGFKNIIFSGMDLAFRGNEVYADKAFVKIVDNKYHYATSSKNIVKVKSVTGELAQTRDDYLMFVRHFENILAKKPSDLRVYNTTSFGAYIEGMIFKPLNEIELTSDITKSFVNTTLNNISYDVTRIKNVEDELLNAELNKILVIKGLIIDWENIKQFFDNFFPLAQEIISKITETNLLSMYLQAELLEYAGNILKLSNNNKKQSILNLFKTTKNGIELILNTLSE